MVFAINIDIFTSKCNRTFSISTYQVCLIRWDECLYTPQIEPILDICALAPLKLLKTLNLRNDYLTNEHVFQYTKRIDRRLASLLESYQSIHPPQQSLKETVRYWQTGLTIIFNYKNLDNKIHLFEIKRFMNVHSVHSNTSAFSHFHRVLHGREDAPCIAVSKQKRNVNTGNIR